MGVGAWGLGVQGSELQIWDSGSRVYGFGLKGFWYRDSGSEIWVYGLGFGVQGRYYLP